MSNSKDDKMFDSLAPVVTQQNGEIEDGRRTSITDAVFGQIREDGPNYRDVSSLTRCCLLFAYNKGTDTIHRLGGWEPPCL